MKDNIVGFLYIFVCFFAMSDLVSLY